MPNPTPWGLGLCAPKKPKTKTPESLVLKAVLKYLALCRLGKVTRNNVGMVWTGGRTGAGRPVRFGTPGQADVTVSLTGDPRQIHVECKAGKGTLTDAQRAWGASEIARGNVYLVARSVMDVYTALTDAGFTVPRPGARRAA